MVDTNVFVGVERSGKPVDFSGLDGSARVYISAVVVSELLMGVHRAATDDIRQRRSAFVELIISGVGVLDFTSAAARVHAKIHAELVTRGQMIGAHDLIIAATAISHDLALLTGNVGEFSRVPGLRVVPFI